MAQAYYSDRQSPWLPFWIRSIFPLIEISAHKYVVNLCNFIFSTFKILYDDELLDENGKQNWDILVLYWDVEFLTNGGSKNEAFLLQVFPNLSLWAGEHLPNVVRL